MIEASKLKSVIACRDISHKILVAWHKFLIVLGRRAGDFARPGRGSSVIVRQHDWVIEETKGKKRGYCFKIVSDFDQCKDNFISPVHFFKR